MHLPYLLSDESFAHVLAFCLWVVLTPIYHHHRIGMHLCRQFLEISAGTGSGKKVVLDVNSDGKTKVHEGTYDLLNVLYLLQPPGISCLA